MSNRETMSREEIMEMIQEESRHSGVLLEQMDDKYTSILEVYDLLDNKIDRVDRNLEDFRKEAHSNFNFLFESQKRLFEENQQIFQEMRVMREEFSQKFETMDKKFSERFEAMDKKFSQRFEAMDEKFSRRFDKLEKTL